MANTLFEQRKAGWKKALQDEDFRRKNQLYQDPVYLENELASIDALTQDISVSLHASDVISQLGMLVQDVPAGLIRFDTRGFLTTLSAFREGLLQEPKKIWKRLVDDSQERYLLADRSGGIIVLNRDVEVLHRFPRFGTDLSIGQYNDSNACCTFTINDVEYLAVTMYSHHMCHIYAYDSPHTFQSAIGEIDIPGEDSTHLNNPVAVAVDEANAKLFILCEAGQPVGATVSKGYVVEYNITDPTTPVFTKHFLYYIGTGSLLDVEGDVPTDIFFDDGLLWVTNGNNEAGAIDVSGSSYNCVKYIEPSGGGYSLVSPIQISVHTAIGGFKKVYIANAAVGLVEEFDQLTLKHLNTIGYRALEDELNGFNRMSEEVYGAIGFTNGVVADRVLLQETKETDVLVCADGLNKRVHRFNLNAYDESNFVNFGMLTFSVPVSITGWSVTGTVPSDMIQLFYRVNETDDFQILDCNVAGLPATSTVQFRLGVTLDRHRFVREWFVKDLIIHGVQA